MAIEKQMPESPTTEEQNKPGLATAVAERPQDKKPNTSEDKAEQDSKKAESEKPQVELEFKIFQSEKDKEITKKAKELAKRRFDELQNTSSNLNLSKLEQSIVKMLAPDVFAFINPEDGKVLGTLSTAKKEDPFAQYSSQSQVETTEREILDGKEFIVTYNPVTKEETSRVLADAEYVQKGEQEPIIELETAAPKVLDGSRIQLLQSLASEMQEYAAYVEEVSEGGQTVFKVNTDKVLDDLNAGKLSREQVRHILEGNNEHFSGVSLADGNKTSEIEHDAEIKFTQHDLAEVIKTGYFGREKLEKYKTTPEGHFEVKLIDSDTGETRWITSKSSDPKEQDNKDPNLEKQVERRRIQQELARQFHSEEEQSKQRAFEQRVESQFLLDPETGEPVINPKTGKHVHHMGGGTLPPTPPALDAETAAAIAEAERIYISNGTPAVEARAKAVDKVTQEVIAHQFRQREAETQRAQEYKAFYEGSKFDREWETSEGRNLHYQQARKLYPDLPESMESLRDQDAIEAFYKAREAAGLHLRPPRTWQEAEARSPFAGGRIPEAQENKEFSGKTPSFDQLYKMIFPNETKPEHVRSLKDLTDAQKDYFIHHLPANFDMNTIIKSIVVGSSANRYPGSDLAIILEADKKMGLDGALVRRRVEQLIAFEEFDEDKQMREGNIGSLIQGIGQFLSAEPDLQHALRVEVVTRMKLHETTIIARYLGVDKLADQMSNFYQDEFNVIMNTRLFREASTMLETEDGAYFRKGRGFDTPEEEYKHKLSGRYDATTMKMALLLMPNLSEEEWDPKNTKFSRKAAMEVARRFVEKTNLLQRYKDENNTGGQSKEIADIDQVMDEIITENKYGLTKEQKASLKDYMEKRSTMSRLVSSEIDFDKVYKILKLGFDKKQANDKRIGGASSMGDAIDELARAGEKSGDPLFTRLVYQKDEKGEVVRDQNGKPIIEEEQKKDAQGNPILENGRPKMVPKRRALTEHEKQDLIDVFNEANRAFGLSNRMADIYGTATRYDGLLDKSGKLIRPKTAILKFPEDLNWKHIYRHEDDEDENDNARFHLAVNLPGFLDRLKKDNPSLAASFNAVKDGNWKGISEEDKSRIKKEISDYMNIYLRDPKMQDEAQKLLKGYVKEYRDIKIDLTKLDKLTERQKKALNIIRELKFKAIRDTQSKAIREMIRDNWDNIDFDDSTRGTASKEYKKAMWNQIQLMGFNKDTKGKPELRMYASTEIVALTDDNARGSVLEQMGNWNPDFQNMKKHNEELKVGAALRKALIEAKPGIFNSTSKLNDPVESLKHIKDEYLTDWTQEHRADYMNFLGEGVLLYIAKYNNKNDGYKNASIVKEMNLMQDMINNSIITQGEKRKVETELYGGHVVAQVRYFRKKGEWIPAILEFIGEIFKESAKGLTK